MEETPSIRPSCARSSESQKMAGMPETRDRVTPGDAVSDQVAIFVELTRALEADSSGELSLAPEQDEAATFFEGAEPDRHFITVAYFTRDLNPQFELIGPHVRKMDEGADLGPLQ